MEIRINREVLSYEEQVFFGLSLRQLIFIFLGLAVSVGLYFLFNEKLGLELTSWICILGATPFVAMGFVKYHGMTAERFLVSWIRSELLMPKHLVYRSENVFHGCLMEEGK